MNWLEISGAVLGTLGIWCGTRRSLWTYPFGLAASAIYVLVFVEVKLYSDALLQVFFISFLLYGWWQWQHHRDDGGRVVVTPLARRPALLHLALGIAGALLLGGLMHTLTDAALPWMDASLASGSLVASYWSARRHIANWWLWIGVDVIYIGMYIYKGLWATSLFYAVLVLLAVLGLRTWQQSLSRQATAAST